MFYSKLSSLGREQTIGGKTQKYTTAAHPNRLWSDTGEQSEIVQFHRNLTDLQQGPQ